MKLSPSSSDVITSLCHSITASSEIRVKGVQIGYRCKATYSLQPSLEVSPLSMPLVNDVAKTVATFCRVVSRLTPVVPHFFCEVCVKVNRRGKYLVKLVLRNYRVVAQDEVERGHVMPAKGDAVHAALGVMASATSNTAESLLPTVFDYWRHSTEPHELEMYLKERHPSLVALVAHVRIGDSQSTSSELSQKPDKHCDYVPLMASQTTSIVEYTTNNRPFLLSADSFCEVNHAMEDAIVLAIAEFLRLDWNHETADDEAGRRCCNRRAFICGRDVNSVVRTFEAFYRDVAVVTTCPSVFADTKSNAIEGSVLCQKDAIAFELDRFASMAAQAPLSPAEESGAAHAVNSDAHVLITAGRHGLHPSTTLKLNEMAHGQHINDLIYVSCNVASMSRDVFAFKEAFFISNTRTFDFFPGTDYVMTVLHLQPLRCSPYGRLLILPVGPPGVGKSSCGQRLATFFKSCAEELKSGDSSERYSASPNFPDAKKSRQEQKMRIHAQKNVPCYIPRSFMALPTQISFHHVERDRIFSNYRKTLGLKAARVATHRSLLESLHSSTVESPTSAQAPRCVVYLDSTNGSAEARQLYMEEFSGDFSAALLHRNTPSCVVLVLRFLPPPVTELLVRVQHRMGHPSFPEAVVEQERKLDVISEALKRDECLLSPCGNGLPPPKYVLSSEVFIHSSSSYGSDSRVRDTSLEVLVAVMAHLLFRTEIAALFLRDALDYLLRDSEELPSCKA